MGSIPNQANICVLINDVCYVPGCFKYYNVLVKTVFPLSFKSTGIALASTWLFHQVNVYILHNFRETVTFIVIFMEVSFSTRTK